MLIISRIWFGEINNIIFYILVSGLEDIISSAENMKKIHFISFVFMYWYDQYNWYVFRNKYIGTLSVGILKKINSASLVFDEYKFFFFIKLNT